METIIKWNDGEGNIVATYTGSGNAPISLTSNINGGLDREQKITIRTTKGDNAKTINIIVKQIGAREIFNTTDGFTLADGKTFNVLK